MKNGNIFIGGMMIGMLMGGGVFAPAAHQMGKDLSEHRQLVTDCERDKPRNISCILTATVQEQK